jgi:cytochrome c553
MNRVFLPSAGAAFVKSLLVAALAVSGLVCAAEQPAHGAAAPAAPVKADAAKGGSLYDTGDAARSLPACVSCHGAAGNSTIATNPKLAGQIESYVHKQLVDFTGAYRNQANMTTYAKMLTDDEKKNVAAYLGAQQQKQGAARSKDTLDLGKKIYRGGIADKGVAACASCHGATGAGLPIQYPRLSGQHQD